MKKISIGYLIVSLAFGSALFAQSKIGTSSAPFLGISVGPKGIALGGAFVAMANDASALYYNPGAISQPGYSQVLVSHTDWLVDTKFDWVGVMLNLGDGSAVGVSVTQLDYGEEIVTTDLNQMGGDETWTATDIAVGISYARNLTDKFSIGGTAKYIQQRIWNESASTMAADVGLKYVTDFNGLTIGMSISNFGGDMRLDGKDLYRNYDAEPYNNGNNGTIVTALKTDEFPLPLLFRAGISIDAVKNEELRFTVAADALRPSDSDEILNVGGELAWRDIVFLRGGLKSLFLTDREESFTVGGGAKYELTGANVVSFDFSHLEFGKFGGIQTFSIGITF
jgi:hypothetical protein